MMQQHSCSHVPCLTEQIDQPRVQTGCKLSEKLRCYCGSIAFPLGLLCQMAEFICCVWVLLVVVEALLNNMIVKCSELPEPLKEQIQNWILVCGATYLLCQGIEAGSILPLPRNLDCADSLSKHSFCPRLSITRAYRSRSRKSCRGLIFPVTYVECC